MQFTVPQFIEKEPKIIGPFTFKQFIFIGIAVGICIFFYFTAPLPVFIGISMVSLGSGFALAFLRIEGIPLPIIIKNFFIFLFKTKIYLWKKKEISPKILKKETNLPADGGMPKEKNKKQPVLKIGAGGRLKELLTNLETKK